MIFVFYLCFFTATLLFTLSLNFLLTKTMNVVVSAVRKSALNPTMIPKKISWPGGPSIKQEFSLPSSVIYYMATHPSTLKCYLKLAQSCKYFYEMLPIQFFADLDASVNGRITICSNDIITCHENGETCCFEINHVDKKIWLTSEITIRGNLDPNALSLIRSKIYRCEILKLNLWHTTVMFDDFKFMATNVRDVDLNDSRIIYSDGVMLETILEAIPNIENFDFYSNNDLSNIITASTMKNIAKLKNLDRLLSFKLAHIPEAFNLGDLSTFIKDHEQTLFYLKFSNNITDDYKNRLDALVDEIIKSKIHNRAVLYPGLHQQKYKILKERYYDIDGDFY